MEGIRSLSPEMSSIIVLRGPHPNQTLQCSRNPKSPNPGTSRSMNAQNIPNMQNSGSMEGVRGHSPEIAEFLQFFKNASIFSSPNIPCSTTKCGSWWMRVSISILSIYLPFWMTLNLQNTMTLRSVEGGQRKLLTEVAKMLLASGYGNVNC